MPRALPAAERQHVLAVLNDERFADLPPAEVYATLLDEGKFVCSIRTMYRILQEHAQVHERRRQLRHPRYAAPELLATGPNQLWSWDITKLKGPGQVDLLLPVRDPGCLLPVRGRLDGGDPGSGRLGPAVDRGDL